MFEISCCFTATKVAEEIATKIAPEIACVKPAAHLRGSVRSGGSRVAPKGLGPPFSEIITSVVYDKIR